MRDRVALALEAIQKMRDSRGWRELQPRSRGALDADVRRIESALHGGDAYAQALDLFDLQARQAASARGGAATGDKPAAAAEPARPPPPPATAEIGGRAAAALEAVDFPAFVASLIHGTFDAIVDASIKQIHEYARLVASLSQSLDEFTQDNVSLNQARDTLAERHNQDLMIAFPKPGEASQPRLVPRPGREGESPSWLARYDLAGQELSEDLTEGPLLDKGRLSSGEDRLQALATTVLMGINRIVVSEGDVRARLQFHATARDIMTADVQQAGAALSTRGTSSSATQMMVSTVKANSQSDASIKTDLMGEVRVTFRSETFPLERFADSAAIQLINRHARWKTEPGTERPAPAATATPAAPAAIATGPAATPESGAATSPGSGAGTGGGAV
ncbi:MAG TPA: hypothetical protein VKB80_27500 [Kofleriaceae bacterium]|nr:hypothetical protein [Kofleriaceae bacterium]